MKPKVQKITLDSEHIINAVQQYLDSMHLLPNGYLVTEVVNITRKATVIIERQS